MSARAGPLHTEFIDSLSFWTATAFASRLPHGLGDSMRRLGDLQPVTVALICAAWTTVIVLLPWLVLFGVLAVEGARNWLAGRDAGMSFGSAGWSSVGAMLVVAVLPPALFLGAWIWSRR